MSKSGESRTGLFGRFGILYGTTQTLACVSGAGFPKDEGRLIM